MIRVTSSNLVGVLILGASLGTTGCLEADIRHTIYLEPEGSVVSEIVGLNIRSDSEDRETRLRDEREFLDELGMGVYEETLFPSGATSIRTTLLRNERPYTVVMTGRYRHADEFFAGMFESWLDADETEARLDYLGDETRLVVSIRTEDEDSDGDPCMLAGTGDGVCSDPETLDDSTRIILTEGRFVEAVGFEIDRDVAIPLAEENVAVRHGVRSYSLTWTTE